MKTKHITHSLLALLVSLFLTACQTESGEMTPQEQETAKKEISARIEEIVQGANRLDVEAALKPYSSAADFLIVSPDGSTADYQTMKNAQTAFFGQAVSNTFKTEKEDFRFLSKTLVLCTWQGSNTFALKSGERGKIEHYTGSMLFSKINNEWTIIYAHESASAPIQAPAKK